MADELIEALRSCNLPAVRSSIQARPEAARQPRAILEAARRAFRPAVEVLHRKGADLNGGFRNYRPPHALPQENPRAEAGGPKPERLACVKAVLDGGADLTRRDRGGYCPIDVAREGKREKLVEMMTV